MSCVGYFWYPTPMSLGATHPLDSLLCLVSFIWGLTHVYVISHLAIYSDLPSFIGISSSLHATVLVAFLQSPNGMELLCLFWEVPILVIYLISIYHTSE